MKKILCLIDGLSSDGAQRQLVGLADLLNRKEYDVLFVWYHKSDFYKNFLIDHQVNFHQLSPKGKLEKFTLVYKEIKQFKPDTIIAYLDSPNRMASFLKIFGLKSKVIVSERAVLQHLTRHHRIKFFMYRWVDYVVSNAQAQTDFINHNFPSLRKKTITIRNFVDTEYFVPAPLSNNHSLINLLVVGRIAKQKNLERFMAAIKKVIDQGIDIRVKWFGGESYGQQEYKAYIEKLHREYSFDGRFEFYPPSKNILEEYQHCDVFCLPSLFEGFPNVVCEAMSCGQPVLCSDVDDNSFVVHDKENGFLFNPLEVDDMVSKIVEFCKLPLTKRLDMGKRSRQIAVENFSGESFVKKYIDLIES